MGVDKSGYRVRRMFGSIAGRYDLLNHVLSLNIDRYWRWRTVRRVSPSGPTPILDLCTGTADLALAYRSVASSATPIVAADFCRPMMLIGQEKADRARADGQLTFVEADAQRLPFADDTFQIVCVAFGLRNVSDTRLGLSEMLRVCRPGGRIAVLEFSQPDLQPFKWFYGLYFRHILPRIGQLVARNDFDAYEYLPASVGEFPSGQRLAALMEQCGMTGASYRKLTLGVATLYVGEKPADCQGD